MTHVVTQSCVGDGSCVYACPVNCIQPTPDDPAFELAEMLHVDPATCMDCGACVRACPVDAIKPAWQLTEDELAFADINARYYAGTQRTRPLLAPVRPPLTVRDRGEPLRVAIVGSGPAAMYAAEELLTIPGAQVHVYERLPTPYGLVRTGVAPDHRRTRRVSRQMEQIRSHPGLTMHLGLEVGRDVGHEQLQARHHAVIYAVGAAVDRRLDVPGGERAVTATSLVGWYTGHPDHASLAVDLSQRRVVIVGNGNVALDIARILTLDPDELADTEVAPAALEQLRRSRVQEVVVAARRGPEHAAFTLPELIGLRGSVRLAADLPAAVRGDDAKLEILRSLPSEVAGRHVTLRFGLNPVELTGRGVVFDGETIDAGLVVSAIGYKGTPIGDLPYDEQTGTVPNAQGRVVPGIYVVGWIKRGPSGFIGTNKHCSQDTVAALVEDWNAGALTAGATAGSTSPS